MLHLGYSRKLFIATVHGDTNHLDRCYGLSCIAACGPCQAENCDNPNNTQEVETEEEEDDDDDDTIN